MPKMRLSAAAVSSFFCPVSDTVLNGPSQTTGHPGPALTVLVFLSPVPSTVPGT